MLRAVLITVAVVLTLFLMYLLRKPLAWLAIAAFIAVAVSGPVNLLNRRMRRGPAIALVYLGLVLIPVLLAALIVPPLIREGQQFVDSFPSYAADVTDFVNGNATLSNLEQEYDLTGRLQELSSELPDRLADAATVLRDLGVGAVNSVFAGVTILLLSIFIVGGAPRWTKSALSRQPATRAASLERARTRIGKAVGNYVGGALLQATIAGVTSFIVLLILGVPFAGPLAVIVFLLDLIPLVGATLGAVIVGIVTLFSDFPTSTIVWVVWAIVYQQIENNVIQPQIQKRAVQVEPIVVLISVLFGSTLFGVIGALIAIPAAASIQIAVKEWREYREDALRIEAGPASPGLNA